MAKTNPIMKLINVNHRADQFFSELMTKEVSEKIEDHNRQARGERTFFKIVY